MPVPNLELAINDPDDSGQGELIMRGAGVFVGYFGQDDLYRQHLTGEGWFRTGDLARIGDDGYLLPHRPAQGHDHPWRSISRPCPSRT